MRRLISIVVLLLLVATASAKPTVRNSMEKLELLLEEEILVERVHHELEHAIDNEETRIKKQLQGEKSMMNFLDDYRKRFAFGPVSGSQFRPGR